MCCHSHICLTTSVNSSTGTHVRSAATVGGNLALSLQRALESDLVTVLMGCGAKVRVASSGGGRCAPAVSETYTISVNFYLTKCI